MHRQVASRFRHAGRNRLGRPAGTRLQPRFKARPLEVGFDYFYGIPLVGQYPHVYIENHHIVGFRPDSPLQIVLDTRQENRRSYLDRQNLVPAHTFTGGEGALYDHEDLAIELTEKTVSWLEAKPKEPFFLYVAFRNVHAPVIPNPRFEGTSSIGMYGDFINELDWSVGEILSALDKHELAEENTLLIFASDNGAVANHGGIAWVSDK